MRKFTLLLIVALAACLYSPVSGKETWPPVLNMPYPDLKLMNQDGKMTRLSQFKGKVILVEPIGMSCQACNAFADSRGAGGFAGQAQQKGLLSFQEILKKYGRVNFPNPDIVVVHLLLYDRGMKPPTLKDAKAWANHFGLKTYNNEYVLVGKKQHQVYELVPGFQLIDRDFRLVSDSTGHHPRNDLYRHLMPMVGRL